MSNDQSNGEVGKFAAELEAIGRDAAEVFGPLSAAQLNWKPSAEQWSVGQCFEHLIKTNEGFFRTLEAVARGERRGRLWERISPLSGFFGKVVMRGLTSPRKFNAPKGIRPSASGVDSRVVARFVEQQGELGRQMRAAGGLDLRRTVITSPISGFVTYSLGDACRIVVAHERRHFEQARRVTQVPGFPSS